MWRKFVLPLACDRRAVLLDSTARAIYTAWVGAYTDNLATV
ncbi:hypothetical protein ACIQI8_36545 [Streptomyces sp. NPDC092369]